MEDLGPFHRVDIRMHVTHTHIQIEVIFGEVFGHAFGEGGDQDPFLLFGPDPDFMEYVIDLSDDRTHFNFGIDEAGGTDDQFSVSVPRLFHFIFRRGCRNVEQILGDFLEFRKLQRSVVQSRGKSESVLDQGFLPGPVTEEHATQLRQGDMTFIDEDQRIRRHVIDQRCRRASGWTSLQDPAVIFDS